MSAISPSFVNAPSRQSPAEPSWPTWLETELDAHALLTELDGVWRGTARIEPTAQRRFAFKEDGELAVVIPVVQNGELIDVVAVRTRFRRSLLRAGDATMLGHDALDRARLWGRKPLLTETPMDWLDRPDSTCIIDPERDAVEALAGVPRVTCDGLRLGERLRAAFRRAAPRAPAITVNADG